MKLAALFRIKRKRPPAHRPLADTWRCHVCGEERPDPMIAVYTKKHVLPGGIVMTTNVRYCVDRAQCYDGAPDIAARWAEPALKGES